MKAASAATPSAGDGAPRRLTLIVPGRLETRTGGYEYDRRMAAGLRAHGWPVDVRELDATFPWPTAAALDHAARVLAAVPGGTMVLIDGLALGAMPAQIEREAPRLRIVALVHLPIAAEVGLDREPAMRLEASERRALAAAVLVVVTGESTIDLLMKYGITRDRIVVIEPGTDRAPLARGSNGAPLELVSVATLNRGKGHEILIRALAAIQDHNWHLTCAGSLDRDPATVDRVRATLRAECLEDHVSLVGELDREALGACYDRADLFVLATLRETYGMAVAEALARGLPVVSTTTGAIPELVNPDRIANPFGTGSHDGSGDDIAGVLVPPGDQQALTDALSYVLGDASVRVRLADGARRLRDRLPTWDEASGKMATALDRIATDG